MKVKINMKKYLFVLMLLPLLWVGCEENNYSQHLRELKSNLIGTWQWVETYVDLSDYDMITPDTEGYNQYYIFGKDDTWKLMRDERLLGQGIFKVETIKDEYMEVADCIHLYSYNETCNDDHNIVQILSMRSIDNNYLLTIRPYPPEPGLGASLWEKTNYQ